MDVEIERRMKMEIKKIICKFLGHKWEEVYFEENEQQYMMVGEVCQRCGKFKWATELKRITKLIGEKKFRDTSAGQSLSHSE